MDESTKIWDKKTSDLTVKDQVLLSVAIPAIMVGGMLVAGAVLGAKEIAVEKFRSRKNNQTKTTN
jgi:hypothetical protein